MPTTASLNLNSILSGILFGGIGTAAFFYGRKQALWKPMVIGTLLVAQTYFITNTALSWVVGSVLTAGLWFFRHD